MTHALRNPPTVESQRILDRTVPKSVLEPDMRPSRAASEALAVMSDRLRRFTAGLERGPTLLE